MLPRAIDLEALIRAHPFIKIERPPEVWLLETDDLLFIRFFGELIAAILARNGGNLAAVTISFANVVIEPAAAGPMPQGEFVAITGFFDEDAIEIARVPDATARPPMVGQDLESAAAAAGAAWAYTRALGEQRGSVTVLFSRMRPR